MKKAIIFGMFIFSSKVILAQQTIIAPTLTTFSSSDLKHELYHIQGKDTVVFDTNGTIKYITKIQNENFEQQARLYAHIRQLESENRSLRNTIRSILKEVNKMSAAKDELFKSLSVKQKPTHK